jgi:hypothetical protein
MPIKITIKPNGEMSVDCDTLPDAAALIRELRHAEPAKRIEIGTRENGDERSGADEFPDFYEFWHDIGDDAQSMIRRVAAGPPEGVEATELAGEMEIGITQLGWIRRKLKGSAAEHGYDLAEFLRTHKIKGDDEKLKTAYVVTDSLRRELRRISELP